MKTALSVVFYIFGIFSVLFSFVIMSMQFNFNETEKVIGTILIIFFIDLEVSFIILSVIILKSKLSKNKAIKLNAIQYRDTKCNKE
ncbi:hypothetical protein [Staphylococcus casei]|uniref:Uncharacterized protein n=1 Tax=Staphylococcus casei TaxID=201828 RepID=A0ABZ2WBD7_9STAP